MSNLDFAGVIAVTPDNRIILQVRDDKPDIVDPGKLPIFACRMKPDETPAQGAVRVFKEEVTVDLHIDALQSLPPYQKDLLRHGGQEKSHIFVAQNVNPKDVRVRQDKDSRVIHSLSDVAEENYAPISYDILRNYFRQ